MRFKLFGSNHTNQRTLANQIWPEFASQTVIYSLIYSSIKELINGQNKKAIPVVLPHQKERAGRSLQKIPSSSAQNS